MTKSEPQTTHSESPVALVTGAGRRVGNALALALGEKGYEVLTRTSATGRRNATIKLPGQFASVIVLSADLRDEAATRRTSRHRWRHARIDAYE
jgi:NAD(P)-dependent dehydrogenase (short-subunit alcohol dehydrogenase family)